MVYMDYNATTPCERRVLDEMAPYFAERFFNPSSPYSSSEDALKSLTRAREHVANLIDCSPGEIYFTSGGTESNNWAIKGTASILADRGKHIITSRIEHNAVLKACSYLERCGYEVTYLPVDRHGLVDVEELSESVRDDTILISIMHANNEIGTIQPVEEIAGVAREKGVYFHSDAVQAVGKEPLSVKTVGLDMLSLSGHKFYGPKGVGALYIRKGVKIDPLMHGGSQERGMRAGTENVPCIVGLGKAAQIAAEEMGRDADRVKSLRDKMEESLKSRIPEIIFNGHPQRRLHNTTNVCVKHVEGEGMLLMLDAKGICASSGSACTSGSLEPSHVLLALGIPAETAHGSLRLSLGKHNTAEDIEKLVTELASAVKKLREISPFGHHV